MRAIAFYLPQYHPIPENDAWWGKGYTEWSRVVGGTPRFPGHHQPHVPSDLGFYDLRVPEVREEQAHLAKEVGIEGFCYYHYWFHGKRLLERPFDEVLASGRPDFPFCICWANEDWSRVWNGQESTLLMRQEYSEEDDRRHIRWLINAFKDRRYIRVAGKPLLLIYKAGNLPHPRKTADLWRQECRMAGLDGVYLCKVESSKKEHGDPADIGFDASVEFQPDWQGMGTPERSHLVWRALRKARLSNMFYKENYIYRYASVIEKALQKPRPPYRRFPCVTPQWDNSARRTKKSVVLAGSTPALYEQWLRAVGERMKPDDRDANLVFINAWNEWSEGCHLEPDRTFGTEYLDATRRVLRNSHA